MKKHLKVAKIERDGNCLEIWVKGNYNKLAPYYEKKFYDVSMSFLGTYIDVESKYIILKFVLRNKEDILPYLTNRTNNQEEFVTIHKALLETLLKQNINKELPKYSMDDQVDY